MFRQAPAVSAEIRGSSSTNSTCTAVPCYWWAPRHRQCRCTPGSNDDIFVIVSSAVRSSWNRTLGLNQQAKIGLASTTPRSSVVAVFRPIGKSMKEDLLSQHLIGSAPALLRRRLLQASLGLGALGFGSSRAPARASIVP